VAMAMVVARVLSRAARLLLLLPRRVLLLCV
jgi:hypothetical protein